MPDFERSFDALREALPTDPCGKCYERGFTAGKTYARWQVVAVACVALGLYVLAKGMV